jgi:hypothetical protein
MFARQAFYQLIHTPITEFTCCEGIANCKMSVTYLFLLLRVYLEKEDFTAVTKLIILR